MKRAIIESPYAGDVEGNIEYLGRCVRDCLQRGESPYASHGLLTRFLDDATPEERRQGIEAGYVWARDADVIAFYLDRGMSRGMREALVYHAQRDRKIEARLLSGDAVVTFNYKNYRGKTEERHAIVRRFYWGRTQWHPHDQVLMSAYCLERQDERTFAVADMEIIPSAAA